MLIGRLTDDVHTLPPHHVPWDQLVAKGVLYIALVNMGISDISPGSRDYPSWEWCVSNGYRIPRWLIDKGIRCPFTRGIRFKGIHGIINCRRVGDGEHVVLTFHGLSASLSAFDEYSDVLGSNGFTVVSFDLYGHGLSDIPSYDVFGKRYSIDFFIDQAEDVIKYLGLNECKLTVMGISMGGCLAAAYCDRHPDLVERIILISPAGLIPTYPLIVKVIKCLHCFIPCAPNCICRCCFSRKALHKPLSAMTNAIMWRFFVTPKSSAGILGILKRMPLWNSDELYKRVGALGKPTLIAFGANDTVTPPVAIPKFKEYFCNSQTILFPLGCHLMSFLMPTEIASTCLAFINIPADSNVADYSMWLPFRENGTYIPRNQRKVKKNRKKWSEGGDSPSSPNTCGDENGPNIQVKVSSTSIQATSAANEVSGEAVDDEKQGLDTLIVMVTIDDYENLYRDEPA